MKKVYHKRTDLYRNRVIIPIDFVRKYGRDYYMEVYEDKIIIKPITKKEK